MTSEEIFELTAKKLKSLQIEQLRLMGIPHFVNAAGRPIVPRDALMPVATEKNLKSGNLI